MRITLPIGERGCVSAPWQGAAFSRGDCQTLRLRFRLCGVAVRSSCGRKNSGKKKRNEKREKRRGRFKTSDQIAQAERTEAVFPEGVPPSGCKLSHVRSRRAGIGERSSNG